MLVVPAKAGTQRLSGEKTLGTGLHRDDEQTLARFGITRYAQLRHDANQVKHCFCRASGADLVSIN